MKNLGLQIVIIDGGFVYVGHCECDTKWFSISGARNVRKWGTTRGLGQLHNGPTADTVLDDKIEVLVPLGRIIHMIRCDPEKWEGHL